MRLAHNIFKTGT